MSTDYKFFFLVAFTLSSLLLTAQELEDSNKTSVQLTREEAKDSIKTLQDSIDFIHFDGDYKKAILKSLDVIKFAEKNKDTGAAYYSRYMIAASFLQMGDYESARTYAKTYTQYTESVQDTFKMARAFNLEGALAVELENYREALSFFKKAEPLSLKDTLQLGILYYNFSETYLRLNDIEQALLYFEKTQKKLDALDTFSGLTTELNLLEGKLKLRTNQLQKALANFEAAIDFAERADYKDSYYTESFKEYSNALYEAGRLKEAFEARKMYDSLYAEQLNKEKRQAVQNARAKFNVEDYREKATAAELEKQLSEQKATKNELIAYISIGVVILLLFGIFIIVRNHRKRKNLLKSLKRKNKQYLMAKEDAEKAEKAKGTFFSTVSHELRTPLYGVIGLTDVLLKDNSLREHKSDLEHLKFSADYLMALINDVLQISKMDTDKLEDIQSRKSTFNVSELIRTIATSFEYVFRQNKNKLELNISEDIPKWVIGNQTRLSQVLMNLIGNASKFTKKGTVKVIVTTEANTKEEVTLKFSIKDDGVGIPKEKQDLIFEEFTQINASEQTLPGTGLGLPIVKKLLEASGSSIHLSSEKGKGSVFWFSLSFKIADKAAMEPNKTNQKANRSLSGKNVLIVDDNHINQLVTKKILENQKMNAFVADNGDEALQTIRKRSFDLVLMDLNMPGKSGTETAKEIRTFNKTLPIIALTAMEADEVRKKVRASGMDGVIAKPYNTKEFLQIIQNTIAQGNS